MTAADAKSTPPPPKAKQSLGRRVLKNALRAAAGVAVGLVIAEVAFWVRDGGAFPHLNVYVEDPKLGVRLRPGAEERVRFAGNPPTSVRVNSEGYRGAEWPAPKDDEIVVVGDSQAFGLGVEENETFSASLAQSMNVTVRNLGVPTYGPPEYNAILEEQLAKRKAKTVVYLVNVSNDFFEAARPNTTRHAVWDGWAVRRETAPATIRDFPGRSWLYGRSHAFYALRRWAYSLEPQIDERGFASEGTYKDIASAGAISRDEHAAADAETRRLRELHEIELRSANAGALAAEIEVENKVISNGNLNDIPRGVGDLDEVRGTVTPAAIYQSGRLSPGDIVTEGYGEWSRSVRVNADQIRRGALMRVQLEKVARERAQRENDKDTLASFAKRDAQQKRVTDLRAKPLAKVLPRSPLSSSIAAAKAICDRHGARLVVVALPLDVMVSEKEWEKYGAKPLDMAPAKILMDDVVSDAKSVGADGLDATAALAAAEPGAFLQGDIHMTPKGHAALAGAIAAVLKAPRFAIPGDGLPAGRTLPPNPGEWTPSTEIAVEESDPAGCETKRIHDWLGVFCRGKSGVRAINVASGVDVRAGVMPESAVLLAPLFPGQDARATFQYDGSTRELTVKVGAGGDAQIAFSKATKAGPAGAPAASPEVIAFCTCWASVHGGRACEKVTAPPDPDCARSWGDNCAALVACAAGDPAFAPKCPAGQANAGASARCMPLCAPEAPCKSGTCREWQGGRVCM
jgi:hypothetical protein